MVSQIIVSFDSIEEMHEKGEPLEQALLDAGIVRFRTVMISVGATILALLPWRCTAARSGSHCVTHRLADSLSRHLLDCRWFRSSAPSFVLDLKIPKWSSLGETAPAGETQSAKVNSIETHVYKP